MHSIRQTDSDFRSWLTQPKFPLPSVPSFMMKIDLLFKQNDEAKRRRSTKSTVVGKAKVISYKDIEKAQVNRAAKEAVQDGAAVKGKHCRKRKSSEGQKARRSEVEIAEDEIAVGGKGDEVSRPNSLNPCHSSREATNVILELATFRQQHAT
jgi:hypothetical protein